MLLDRRKTRIFHVNMAFLLLLNAIVKIKYYITKGSKKDFFFLDLIHYRISKEVHVLELTMNTAIDALPHHVHWNTRKNQIWEHTALQISITY